MSSEIDSFRRDLDRKAEHVWVKGELKLLTKTIDGINAKTKEKHSCLNAESFKNLRIDVNLWTSWWKKAMFMIITSVVIGSGGIVTWLMLHNSLDNRVGLIQDNVSQINETIEVISKSQDDMKTSFAEEIKNNKKEKAIRTEEVKQALKEVLIDFSPKKKRRNGRIL